MTVQLEVISGKVLSLEERELVQCEAIIHRGLTSFVEVGRALATIRDKRLYRSVAPTFEEYIQRQWPDVGGKRYADRVISAAQTVDRLGPIGPKLPSTESQARPLTVLSPDEQIEAWQRVLERAGERWVTAKLVEQVVKDLKAEAEASREPVQEAPQTTTAVAEPDGSWFVIETVSEKTAPPVDTAPVPAPAEIASYYMVETWKALPSEVRAQIIRHAAIGKETKFNRTNDNVEWALWTWNPVTGCDHGCDYCYARDIAERFYDDLPDGKRFAPVFRPSRLWAPRKMKVPSAAAHNIGEKNVFTGSMTDLFGKWVPQDWIDAVFQEVVRAAEWNFLFLTKFPQRLAEQDWPSNAWVGTTVDRQARVATAERSFRGVQAGVKWLSCEPMLERLTFTSLEMFDWVVIGGASESSQTPSSQPPAEWVEHLIRQARDSGCQVYFKTNLGYRPREYPTGAVAR
jgi:protein gp37